MQPQAVRIAASLPAQSPACGFKTLFSMSMVTPTELQRHVAAAALYVEPTVSHSTGLHLVLGCWGQKALVARNEQLQKLVEESGKRAAMPDGRPRTAPLVR